MVNSLNNGLSNSCLRNVSNCVSMWVGLGRCGRVYSTSNRSVSNHANANAPEDTAETEKYS